MKLIVGLGNPGDKYKNTRHNLGFMALDVFASKISNKNQKSKFKDDGKLQSLIFTYLQPTARNQQIVFAKPQEFMNNSGQVMKKLLVRYKIKLPDLWVIHDDLDIRLGEFKIQKGKGPKVHNGLLSIYEELSSNNFWHVRIGVDNRVEGNRIPGEMYVLQNFNEQEKNALSIVLEKATSELSEKLFGD